MADELGNAATNVSSVSDSAASTLSIDNDGLGNSPARTDSSQSSTSSTIQSPPSTPRRRPYGYSVGIRMMHAIVKYLKRNGPDIIKSELYKSMARKFKRSVTSIRPFIMTRMRNGSFSRHLANEPASWLLVLRVFGDASDERDSDE